MGPIHHVLLVGPAPPHLLGSIDATARSATSGERPVERGRPEASEWETMTVKLSPLPDHLTFKAYRKVDVARTPGMEAETGYTIRYTILKFPRRGDKVGVNLLLTVEFVEAESWVLRASQNEARLLGHERLHLMLAGCGGYKMHERASGATYADEDAARASISELLAETMGEIEAASIKYDDETDHGHRDRAAQQAIWKARIEAWYRTRTLGGPP